MADEDGNERTDSIVLSRTKLIVGVIGATALLAFNVVQFLYVVNPSLRPDPGETLHAHIHVLAVEKALTLEEYLRRTVDASALLQAERAEVRLRYPHLDLTTPLDKPTCRQWTKALSESGYGVYAEVTVEGLKRRRVALEGHVYYARTGERFEPADAAQEPAREVTSPTDTYVELMYVRAPLKRAKQYVQLELRSVEDHGRLGTLLAIARSDPFSRFALPALPPAQARQCPA